MSISAPFPLRIFLYKFVCTILLFHLLAELFKMLKQKKHGTGHMVRC